MSVAKEPNAEPIAGYRLIEPLGKGGFGEVWKCEAPGGICKAIKFVYGDMNGLEADRLQAEAELRAIERVKAIRHPFLLSMDRVECVDGELMVVSELADKNLHDVLTAYRQAGEAGIPRRELLDYLREAAEVLDLMNVDHGLQHLDIKPQNLFVVGNHVKVADFGLVKRQRGGRTRHSSVVPVGAVTPLYASPELLAGRISAHCDQYSLAIVYQELLTGELAFTGKNARQLLLQHSKAAPNLQPLPPGDRPIVARALAKTPEKRFASCTAFVRALVGADPDAPRGKTAKRNGTATIASRSVSEDRPARAAPLQAPATGTTHAEAAGYRLVANLGSTPLADVWRAQTPDGHVCLVKFIYGFAGGADALARLQALTHPTLLPQVIVAREPGRLVLASDAVEKTLRERCREFQVQGSPGIARHELLRYLQTAAEALDSLGQQHAVYHLGLNPRCLLVEADDLLVADFGLVHLLWLPAKQDVGRRNAGYAPPELLTGQAYQSSDQYSLALIFHEMLTGALPRQSSQRQGRAPSQLTLVALPDRDREIIARALDPDPAARWPSCMELVRALHEASDGLAPSTSLAISPKSTRLDASQTVLSELILALLASAGSPERDETTLEHQAREGELRAVFRAALPLPAVRLKLEAFRQLCYGQPIRDAEDQLVFHLTLPSNLWRQWIGRQPGLEVSIELERVQAFVDAPVDVRVQIRPFRCTRKRSAQLLEDTGAPLLDRLRTYLLVNSEKRIHERLHWSQPMQVRSVAADGTVGPPVECRGKDISLSGIGFYLPCELPTAQIHVYLPALLPPDVSIPATLVRAHRCADGSYEVGAVFCLSTMAKSLPPAILP